MPAARGSAYASYAVATGRAEVVAVAEPDQRRAVEARATHHGAEIVDDWRDLAARPPQADAVIIATQDRHHAQPAVRFAELGYHLLLEKPMAATEQEVLAVLDAVDRADVMLSVCHVLRYTRYTSAVKEIIDAGRLGDIASIEHLEPVGWWHQAHSYVRGDWRREDLASPMLLAKSCHDLDWISYIMGKAVRKVSSFGNLMHFRPQNRPATATARCLDCPVEPSCPYSAKRLYLDCLGNPEREAWPLDAVTSARTIDGIEEALRDGPYGRCVYTCDNDVVDHQVVSLEYENGSTASFTMTGFTPFTRRRTRIFGTHGCLEGDGVKAVITDFVTGREQTLVLGDSGSDAASGHDGGDERLMDAFLDALDTGDASHILSNAGTSLESHRIAWAAERSRRTSTVQFLKS